MHLGKYVPPKFEVGDIVQLIGDYWAPHAINTYAIILIIEWKTERLRARFVDDNRIMLLHSFKNFKLIKKSNKFTRLIL